MTKVKLFTHTDLDGVGCAIVAHQKFNHVDVVYCDYHNVNEKVKDFINEGNGGNAEGYETIFITDISVNEEVADLIEESQGTWQLIDHHGTALHLNKRSWAKVAEHESKGKASGTSLFFEFIGGSSDSVPGEFVEKVRRYDTWEWHDRYDDEKAKELNDLLYILGRDRFVIGFTDSPSVEFTEEERLLLVLEQEKIDRLVESKGAQLVTMDGLGYKAGAVFAESHQSQLGNRLAIGNPNLDFIAMINPGRSVSLRTVKDNVDVSGIAKHFGGGGHPKAAGFPIPADIKDDFIKYLFDGSR